MSDSRLILFGAGSHGQVALDAALSAGLCVSVILDDAPKREELFDVPVAAASRFRWEEWPNFDFLVAVGDNQARRSLFERLIGRNGRPANVVHRTACISRYARLGEGILVCAGAVINPGALLGDNCIINTSASVDHECQIGEHSHIAPGVHLAGNVSIGRGTLIGIGSVILPGVQVGSNVIVGAGSVVTRDIADGAIVFGVPAKVRPFA